MFTSSALRPHPRLKQTDLDSHDKLWNRSSATSSSLLDLWRVKTAVAQQSPVHAGKADGHMTWQIRTLQATADLRAAVLLKTAFLNNARFFQCANMT